MGVLNEDTKERQKVWVGKLLPNSDLAQKSLGARTSLVNTSSAFGESLTGGDLVAELVMSDLRRLIATRPYTECLPQRRSQNAPLVIIGQVGSTTTSPGRKSVA